MFAEMDKVIKCLALELPESVWNDVDVKYRSLKAKVEKLTPTNKRSLKLFATCSGCPLKWVCSDKIVMKSPCCLDARKQLQAGA